jgi:hypothetical protein
MIRRPTANICSAPLPRWSGSKPRSASTSSATASLAKMSAGRVTFSSACRALRKGPGAWARSRRRRGKDRRDFAEFYAEFEAEKGFVGMGKSFAKSGLLHVVGPIQYTGQTSIGRDIENLKSAIAKVHTAGAFLPVVAPASVAPDRFEEYYASADESLLAIAAALHTRQSSMPVLRCRSTTHIWQPIST